MLSNFDLAKQRRDALEAAVKAATDRLRTFPRGANGLTLDSVKATPEWRQAKADFDTAFQSMQAFNKVFVKQFKAELRAARNSESFIS